MREGVGRKELRLKNEVKCKLEQRSEESTLRLCREVMHFHQCSGGIIILYHFTKEFL